MLRSVPEQLTAPDGTVCYGTYIGHGAVDWSAAATKRAWRRRQWKRWHYVSIAGAECVLAAAVVDVGWAGSAFAYLFDRRRRQMVADLSGLGWPGRAASVSSVPGDQAATSFRSRALSVGLERRGDGSWRLSVDSPTLTVEATLHPTPAGPTLCAVAPVAGGVADCTNKTPALEAQGTARGPGVTFDLLGSYGALDHTSGLLARNTSWRWASATDGRTALNFTEGFTAPYENALWNDGELSAVGPVTFAFDRGRPEEPWSITGGDGSIDLQFVPEGHRAQHTNLGLAASRYVQPIGAFYGSVAGTRIDGLAGVTEDHTARW